MPYLLFAIIFCTVFDSANAAIDPLLHIVKQGMENSAEVKKLNLILEKTHNLKLNTYAQLLPTVRIAGSRDYSKDQTISSGSKTTTDSQSDTLTISANWTIWDNYQNITNAKLASLEEKTETIRTLKDIQSYILKVVENYLSIQLHYTQKTSTELLLSQAKKAYDEASIQVQYGSKTKLEIVDTEIDIIDAERDLLEINNNIQTSLRNFSFILNTPEENIKIEEIKLQDFVPFYMEKFYSSYPVIKQNWTFEIETKSPDFSIAKLDYEKSTATYTQAKIGLLPTLSVSVANEYDLSAHIAKNIEPNNRKTLNNLSLNISASWPIWDWWSTPRSTINSYKDFQINQHKFSDDKFKTKNNMQNLIEQYELLEKSITSTKLILDKSLKQFEYADVMYKYGKISLLSRQKAMNQLYQAQTEFYDRMKSKYLIAGEILIAYGIPLI